MPVITSYSGRLCNCIFQYFFGRFFAEDNHMNIIVPDRLPKDSPFPWNNGVLKVKPPEAVKETHSPNVFDIDKTTDYFTFRGPGTYKLKGHFENSQLASLFYSRIKDCVILPDPKE